MNRVEWWKRHEDDLPNWLMAFKMLLLSQSSKMFTPSEKLSVGFQLLATLLFTCLVHSFRTRFLGKQANLLGLNIIECAARSVSQTAISVQPKADVKFV